MQKTILPFSAILVLSSLSVALLRPDPAPGPEKPVDPPNQSREKRAIEEEIVERILLQDSVEILDKAYGSSLVKTAPHSSLQNGSIDRKLRPSLLVRKDELRAYFPKASYQADLAWADKLMALGFLEEAYYHYWMLESSLSAEDKRLVDVRAKRHQCERYSRFYPKGALTNEELVDSKRIVFFIKDGPDGLVEIDPQQYGVPKALEEIFLNACAARDGNDVETARNLFIQLKLALSPESPAFYEASWQVTKLGIQLGITGSRELLNTANNALKTGPELHCIRLNEDILSRKSPGYQAEQAGVTHVYTNNPEDPWAWGGRVFTVRSLAVVSTTSPHSALPARSKFNYMNALSKRQSKVLQSIEGALPKISKKSSESWSMLGNQFIRIGSFKKAQSIFEELATVTKDRRDGFKALGCQIRVSMKTRSKLQAGPLNQLIDQFRSIDPGPFNEHLVYLKGQLAFRLEQFKNARDLFGQLVNSRKQPIRRGAAFYCARLDRQLLRLTVPNPVSEKGAIKIHVTRRSIEKIKFRFLKITETLTLRKDSKRGVARQVERFFARQKKKDLQCVSETLHSFPDSSYGSINKSVISLRLPAEGAWVVEAQTKALKARFIAMVQPVRGMSIQFPESSMVIFENDKREPMSGWTVYSAEGERLGVTDSKGAIVSPLTLDNYRSRHDYQEFSKGQKGWLEPLATVYCSKPGQFFKTVVKLGEKVQENSARGRPTKIYTYTDRPLYQAGETMHFKGFVRKDSVPQKRRASERYAVAVGEFVNVTIKQDGKLVYKSRIETNELGSFQGSYQFSKSASRKKYQLEVQYEGSVATAEIELHDFNKPSYMITFSAIETGFRIFAGHSWGQPVSGASLECFIGKKLVPLTLDKLGFATLKLETGDLVTIGLKKAHKVLLVKSQKFSPRERIVPREEHVAGRKAKPTLPRGKHKKEIEKLAGPSVKDRSPEFQLSLASPYNPKTQEIALKLSSKSEEPWSAWIGFGDTAAFDFRKVESKERSKLVRIKVTRACDPCVYAHVLFSSAGTVHKRQLRIPVRAALMMLEVNTDKDLYEPGQTVRFALSTKRLSGLGIAAEASLAAVDEVIFSLKDDRTPDIYDFFYSDRGTDCHFEKCRAPFYLAQDVLVEGSLENEVYGPVNIEQKNYALYLSVVDAYGIGGGAAGAYGQRWGRGSLSVEGGSEGSESAVTASLRWLGRHQETGGLWDNIEFNNHCKDGESCSLTGAANANVFSAGLAVQSFLNVGHTHRFGTFKRTVKKAVGAFGEIQRGDGSIGIDESQFSFLNHAAATIALSECFAISRDFTMKKLAQKALDFIVQKQIKGSGWSLKSGASRADMLATAWAVHALRAGRLAKLNVPDEAFNNALSFVESVTDSRGWTWFDKIGDERPDWFANKSDFVDYPEWTAMGLSVRLAAKQSIQTPNLLRGLELIQRARPNSSFPDAAVNFQYFYFSTFVFYELGGEVWNDWLPSLSVIRLAQTIKGCADGSWRHGGAWSKLYGRIGNTALAGWTLNLHHRYERGQAKRFKRPLIRLHFPDTVYWNPKIVTNSKGQFSGRFKLPDTITSFRLTGRGVSKTTDVGQVVRWIQVRKDFFVRLQCPKFLYQGDSCQIRADVFNYQGGRQKAELELSGTGYTSLSDSLLSVESTGNGVPNIAYWTVKAHSPNELKLVVKARCGELSDAMGLTIPVRIFGEAKTAYSKRMLDKETELEIKVAKLAAEGSQSLRMVLRPKSSVYFDIFETLDFLVQFPYGCVEQTMSRFLPAVEVGDSFKQLGLPIDKFVKRFDSVTEKGVKRLAGFQKSNGSWGWFSSDAPNPFMTAYVVYGLSRAQKAGIKLDESMIKRGCAYLKTVVKEQKNNDLKSFIYFALQSAGEGDLTEAKALLNSPLSSYAKALLTLTFIRSGDRPAAEKLLGRLEKDRIDTGTLSHFSTPKWFYKWENVSIETSAFAMLAFLEVNPNHEIVPKLKDWLLSKRQGKRWKTTKDSAAAIFGLLKHLVVNNKRESKGSGNIFQRRFTVTLNEKTTRTVVVDLSNPLESQFECLFAAHELKRGRNKLRVSGDFLAALGPVVCQTTTSYVEPRKSMKALNNGLVVSSDWNRDMQTLTVGDEVTVTVNVKTTEDFNYLMINVPIPAGAVVDRKSAKGDFAEFEARHDQGIFFLTDLKAGDHKLRFKFKCKFAGRYRVPGARGELMYSPDINGCSDSVVAEIAPRNP